MTIGIIVQKYFCNNLGVYALSYCAIDTIVSFCKKNNVAHEIRIFTTDDERLRKEITEVFPYRNIKVFPQLEIKDIPSYFRYAKELAACNVVLDTGLGDGFSDIYSNAKFLLQFFLKRIPEWKHCKLILLPQTLGPYKSPLFEKMAAKVIHRSAVCYARDELSHSYAKKIAPKSNVILTTDMAMRLPTSETVYPMPTGMNIGLNVSGLLYMGGYTKSNQFGLQFDYSEFVDKLIERLLARHVNVHLIAHVYRNNGEGDEFANQILSEKYKDLIVAPEFASPMEAKAYIRKMDFFIGSRMHSTIAAISSGIPVCPVGYSRKFNGLFETVGYDNYIDATKQELSDALDKILYMIDHRDEVHSDVINAMFKAGTLGDTFYDTLENVLSG